MIEIRKAHELEVVELNEDLPEYGVHRGDRGTVMEVFDTPEEAYMIEFLENEGEGSKIADWVKPEQITNLDAIAKEEYARGMALLQQGNLVEAARHIHRAVELIPSYIRGLHESFRRALAPIGDWSRLIWGLRFVLSIDRTYVIAKHNLAIAFLNWGAEEANKGNYEDALQLFQSALRVEAQPDVSVLIRENISTTHTALGMKIYRQGDLATATKHFESALTFNDVERTRRDLGLAYFYSAESYLKKNEADLAIVCYEWAQDCGLITPEVLNNQACALISKGDLDNAIVMFEHARALAPRDAVIEANLLRATESKSMLEFVTQNIVEEFSPVPPMKVIEYAALA
jgi:tetratricopeptide (TPR) repeat protein